MPPEAQAAFERAAAVARPELASLPEQDRTVFVLRLKRYWPDLFDGLVLPYAGREDFKAFLETLARLLATSYAARPEELKVLDLERNLTPDWFQSEKRIGYVFYADRFAGNLKGVAERLDYLEDLTSLCALFRERGMSACVDLVLNHCAREHEWAQRARAGEKEYEEMFHIFPDRVLPDEYERTLPEVFPDTTPGNFS